MKSFTIVCLLAFALFITASAASVTITVSKDAQVTEHSTPPFGNLDCPSYMSTPCPNRGSGSILIGNYNMKSHGLFGFDLQTIPQSANITSAQFIFPFATPSFGFNFIPVTIFKLDSNDWLEMSVTASDTPAYDTTALGSTFVNYGSAVPPDPVDVTNAVVNELSNGSIGFRMEVGSPYNVFFEEGAAKLEISYE